MGWREVARQTGLVLRRLDHIAAGPPMTQEQRYQAEMLKNSREQTELARRAEERAYRERTSGNGLGDSRDYGDRHRPQY